MITVGDFELEWEDGKFLEVRGANSKGVCISGRVGISFAIEHVPENDSALFVFEKFRLEYIDGELKASISPRPPEGNFEGSGDTKYYIQKVVNHLVEGYVSKESSWSIKGNGSSPIYQDAIIQALCFNQSEILTNYFRGNSYRELEYKALTIGSGLKILFALGMRDKSSRILDMPIDNVIMSIYNSSDYVVTDYSDFKILTESDPVKIWRDWLNSEPSKIIKKTLYSTFDNADVFKNFTRKYSKGVKCLNIIGQEGVECFNINGYVCFYRHYLWSMEKASSFLDVSELRDVLTPFLIEKTVIHINISDHSIYPTMTQFCNILNGLNNRVKARSIFFKVIKELSDIFSFSGGEIHLLKDMLNQFEKYRTFEKLSSQQQKVLKEKGVEPISFRRRYRSIKDMHDDISLQYLAIEECLNDVPIEYDRTWSDLGQFNGIELSTGGTIIVPDNTLELIRAAKDTKDCVASYKDSIVDGESFSKILLIKDSNGYTHDIELQIQGFFGDIKIKDKEAYREKMLNSRKIVINQFRYKCNKAPKLEVVNEVLELLSQLYHVRFTDNFHKLTEKLDSKYILTEECMYEAI